MEKTQCSGICNTGKQCKIMVVIGDVRRDEYCTVHNKLQTYLAQCLGTTKKGKQCKRKGVSVNGVYSCIHHAQVDMKGVKSECASYENKVWNFVVVKDDVIKDMSEDETSEGSEYIPNEMSESEDEVSESEVSKDVISESKDELRGDEVSESDDETSESEDKIKKENDVKRECRECGSDRVLSAIDKDSIEYTICSVCSYSWIERVSEEIKENKVETKVKKNKENTSVRCHGTTKGGKRCKHKKKMEGVYYCKSHKLMEKTNLILRCDHIKQNGHRCRKNMKPSNKTATNYICHIHGKSV